MKGNVYLDVDDADDLEELKDILRNDTDLDSDKNNRCQNLKDFLFKNSTDEKSD